MLTGVNFESETVVPDQVGLVLTFVIKHTIHGILADSDLRFSYLTRAGINRSCNLSYRFILLDRDNSRI